MSHDLFDDLLDEALIRRIPFMEPRERELAFARHRAACRQCQAAELSPHFCLTGYALWEACDK